MNNAKGLESLKKYFVGLMLSAKGIKRGICTGKITDVYLDCREWPVFTTEGEIKTLEIFPTKSGELLWLLDANDVNTEKRDLVLQDSMFVQDSDRPGFRMQLMKSITEALSSTKI